MICASVELFGGPANGRFVPVQDERSRYLVVPASDDGRMVAAKYERVADDVAVYVALEFGRPDE